MPEQKTKPSDQPVEQFLNAIADETKREDCFVLLKMMQQVTGKEPKLWGKQLIGFGQYRYKGKSGREGDWFLIGFSPTKNDISIYILSGFDVFAELMKKLGKHKTGKGCLYIKKLEDVDVKVLKELVVAGYEWMANRAKQ
jgi:Domain of unknown function (DU1801)